MNAYSENCSISEMIKTAIKFQNSGLHLKSRNLIAQASAINPNHPDILQFFRVRTKRSHDYDEYYYEEPEVSCCCCPMCSGNLAECLCHAAICDFCCIPGGCCVIGK